MNKPTFTFTDISFDEANMILAGLQELPAKVANPLTQKLQSQAQGQMPKAEAPAADTPEE
jgi:hypothetical protein